MTRARCRHVVLLCCALAALAVPLATAHAQRASDGPPRRGWIRPAKWIALGAAAALAGYAVVRTSEAHDAYARLRESCTSDPARCTLAGGVYRDAGTERLFRSAADDDRRAQRAIIGGQTLLFASATLFVLDLRDRGPADIPYPTGAASCASARCFRLARLTF
jgi:hypothetical protein